ncbi:MAG: UDP-galactopyranose mutase [uncultured archaeon A07HR60]|nr:MAG: UDP-galactopyranose mutase [uncultured archaeon A07HR60]
MDTEVHIVGGGLAGLVAARRLATDGADVTLFEREAQVGGRVQTHTVDGFTLDRGFQVLFTSYPAAQRELDLDALDLRSFAPGATICRPNSRAVLADPLRAPGAALESAFNTEVTFTDKLRTLLLRFGLTQKDSESFFNGPDIPIREYLSERGFSPAYVDNFVAPFYGGITLDRSLSTSKHVFEYTFRCLSTGQTVVPAAGIEAIPQQLARRARESGVTVETETHVESVTAESEGVTVATAETTYQGDAAIIATPAPEARRLSGVESIPTDTAGCVTQWYTLPEGIKFETGKQILLNAASSRPNSVVPASEVAPEYSPEARTLLNATFLGAESQTREPEALLSDTREALSSWYPERSFDGLELLATDRIPDAQFSQPPGVFDGLPAVDAPAGPVFLAGEFTEWSAIQGALESGRHAAAAVTDKHRTGLAEPVLRVQTFPAERRE